MMGDQQQRWLGWFLLGGGEELSASSVFSPDVTHSGLTSLCDALTLSQVEAMRGSLPPQRV